ncbi:unnamed protein product [Heterobilharzia americana]|nr:unnamed protein product [Heterobilharzia americana]
MKMTTENASSKNWELTLYELHRKPQEPITDGTVIAVSPRSLKSELMCPICLDILKVTMTTKECLHRFCSECIITALRSGNKECPTCRKKLVSKRSLRRDPNFDALIAKIYPSRQEYEAHQDKILARLNRQHLSASLTRSLEQQLGINGNNAAAVAITTTTTTTSTTTNTVAAGITGGRSRSTINTGRVQISSITGNTLNDVDSTTITTTITNATTTNTTTTTTTTGTNEVNTDAGISEDETLSNFAVNGLCSRRRVSALHHHNQLTNNSDTESGMDTNSIGENSSISDLPIVQHRSNLSANTTTTTNTTNIVISSNNQANSTGSNLHHSQSQYTCSIDRDNLQVNNTLHNTNSISSVLSPSVFPEIEVLLKPHPRYSSQYTAAATATGLTTSCSPSTSTGHRNNSSHSVGIINNSHNNYYHYNNANNNYNDQGNGLIKYLKAPTITTVDHLCRYLTVRINLQRINREVSDESVRFVLYSYNENTNTYQLLDSHTSIEEISREQFHGVNCLDLYYARDDLFDDNN